MLMWHLVLSKIVFNEKSFGERLFILGFESYKLLGVGQAHETDVICNGTIMGIDGH